MNVARARCRLGCSVARRVNNPHSLSAPQALHLEPRCFVAGERCALCRVQVLFALFEINEIALAQ